MLACVRNREGIDLNKLPSSEEFYQIYSQDLLIPCLDAIEKGYQRKIQLLEMWMKGEDVFREMRR